MFSPKFFFSFRNLWIPHFIFLTPAFDFNAGPVALLHIATCIFPSHCLVALMPPPSRCLHRWVASSSCHLGELLCVRTAPTALIPQVVLSSCRGPPLCLAVVAFLQDTHCYRRLTAVFPLFAILPSHCRLAPARISRSVLPSWCLAACHRLTILPCPRCLPPFCPGVHKSYRLARSLHRLPPCIVVYCCVLLCMHFAFWYIIKYRNKSDWVTSPSLLVASSGWLHHCSQYFVTAVIESWLPVGIEGSLLGNTLAALGLATGKVG